MSIFEGHETISNHGTSQGIIPRFFLQTLELATSAFGKTEGDKKVGNFLSKNIPDFTNFYDLHQEITSDYNDFKNGLSDGRYFSINDKGQFKLDRSVEISMEKKIKDFFILGRLLVNNFAKSGLIDSEYFKLNDIFIVREKNFIKNKTAYTQIDSSKRFEILFDIVEQARDLFLTEFNQIRADIEHQNLSIPKFEINTKSGEITEPSFKGNKPMIDELNLYYGYLLDTIELLIAFYFAIEAITKKPMFGMFERENYDYTKMILRFCIMPKIQMGGMKLVYSR